VLEIYVFDVPGALAVFIRTPGDKRVLINGGANSEIIRHVTDILPFYSRRIDMIVATSDDGKDITGLIDVLNRYDVSRVVSIAASSSPIYGEFVKAIGEKGITPEIVGRGDHLELDSGVVADVLFPVGPNEFAYSNASRPEMVLRIVHGKNSFLLLGKATTKIQKFLVSSGLGTSDVLIVSNNPATNLTPVFLAATEPDYLVYSASIKPAKDDRSALLAGILADHRFNVRETGVVKIISDGSTIRTSK